MADIRISSLPNEPAPNGSDFVPIDLASTRKTTVTLLTEAGRPAASQAEAEAGTNPTKVMTPVTTKQAVTFYGPTLFQPLSTKLTNLDGTALSAGGMLFGAGVNTWSVLPLGSANQFLTISGGNPTWVNAAAGGDVTGPASSISGTLPTFNGATGKIIQAGNPLLADLLSAQRGPMSTIANNVTDATNDIDFSAGSAFSTDATHWPMVGTASTKQLDAAWAVGNNAGGRMSAAAIANTTYHCFQIRRPDTGVVDFGFDVSATAPTLPTNYTQYRRIGCIVRSGGVILPFRQTFDTFRLVTSITAVSSSSAFASTLTALGIPIGLNLQPILRVNVTAGGGSSVTAALGDAATGAADVNVVACVSATGFAGNATSLATSGFFTDTSARVYVSFTIGAGTGTITANTLGWIDDRGKG